MPASAGLRQSTYCVNSPRPCGTLASRTSRVDNAVVRELIRRLTLGTVTLVASCASAHALPVKDALAQVMHGTQASAVVLDTQTGAVLASEGKLRQATPGSAIKPLLLAYGLEHGIVNPEMQVYC